jgi:hypothetical protein
MLCPAARASPKGHVAGIGYRRRVTENGNRRLAAPEASLIDANAAWSAVLEAVPDVARGPDALDAFTPAVRRLHAMSLLAAEVNNGGFSQFFFNGGGPWLDDAIAGFNAVGLDDYRQLTADVADAVVARLDELVAAQRGRSLEAFEAWASKAGLEAFDDRWWELPDLDPVLDRFVAEHAAELWEPAS